MKTRTFPVGSHCSPSSNGVQYSSALSTTVFVDEIVTEVIPTNSPTSQNEDMVKTQERIGFGDNRPNNGETVYGGGLSSKPKCNASHADSQFRVVEIVQHSKCNGSGKADSGAFDFRSDHAAPSEESLERCSSSSSGVSSGGPNSESDHATHNLGSHGGHSPGDWCRNDGGLHPLGHTLPADTCDKTLVCDNNEASPEISNSATSNDSFHLPGTNHRQNRLCNQLQESATTKLLIPDKRFLICPDQKQRPAENSITNSNPPPDVEHVINLSGSILPEQVSSTSGEDLRPLCTIRVTDSYDVYDGDKFVGERKVVSRSLVSLHPVAKHSVISSEVVEQWRLLQQKAANQQHQADAVNRLHVRCSDLHSRLTRVDTDLTSLSDSPGQLNSIGQVNDRISQLKELQCSLTECCQSLTIINTDAHRHANSTDKGAVNSRCADNDAENCQSQDKLRTEIARLYLLVDKLSERLSGSLDWLESLQSVWSRYLSATEQVQAALEHDRQLLAGLQRQTGDSTTTTGHTPPPQSGHVRRKRGCLSDADREQLRQLSSLLNAPNQNPLLNGSYSLSGSRDDLSSEGTSGYDSACSDEMNTHAKRVGRLSRLASRLQTLLPPRSAAYNEVQQTVSSASTELQDLQLTCNKLITMTCVGESAVNTGSSPIPEASTATAPVSQCKRPFSWLRRVLRVALPFQLILLVCVCAACLLEPTCSGSGCRFHLSFEPQLRYLNGPPPI